jgi:DNA-directed RNA polymerase subunit M/transcription elongation factor TFIIS
VKIPFRCPGCGKMLKARPDSVGRTRKCPVCATHVTCPEPVLVAHLVDGGQFDAEVIEAEVVPAVSRSGTPGSRPSAPAARGAPAPEPAPGFNPFADVDDDPYRLADPDPATTSTSEPQKPCPMCGEMILAAAVKCRYCGETFDPKLKKGKKSKKKRRSSGGGSSSTGPRDIGIGLLCMALGIGLTVASAMASDDGKGGGGFVLFYGLIIGGFLQMCRGFYTMLTG